MGAGITVALCGTSSVWGATGAVFTKLTSNSSNAYAAGNVTLSDSKSGTALFNVTGLKPGSTGTQCLTVTYSGSLNASIKLRGSSTGTLPQYVTLKVERGTGTCASFGTSTTLFNAAGNTLPSAYVSGLGTWSVTGGTTVTQPFQVTYLMTGDNAAISATGTITLTWEAQST